MRIEKWYLSTEEWDKGKEYGQEKFPRWVGFSGTESLEPKHRY